VTTWNDLSGYGNNATASNTPSYEVNEFNGGTMPGVVPLRPSSVGDR